MPVADCQGQKSLSTKVDAETIEFLDEQAAQAGVTRAEFVRRLLDAYQDSTTGSLSCGACGAPLNLAGVLS